MLGTRSGSRAPPEPHDPAAAVAEMVHVMAPTGRIVFSAWLPGGTIGRLAMTAMDLVRNAVGAPTPPKPFGWRDQRALDAAFAAHGMTVVVEAHELAFTATSPAAYLEAERTSHPISIAGFDILDRAGQADRARKILLEILAKGNESSQAFLSINCYAVVTATRRWAGVTVTSDARVAQIR